MTLENSSENGSSNKIFMLWVELERAYHDGPYEDREPPLLRLQSEPWDSSDPYVQRAWKVLTAPENLNGLKEWHSDQHNELAQKWTLKALELCQRRLGEG